LVRDNGQCFIGSLLYLVYVVNHASVQDHLGGTPEIILEFGLGSRSR
jgi:hypothetical protein